MNRRHVIALLLALSMVFSAAGFAAAAEKTYTFKIAHIGTDNDASGVAFKYLKKILEERTKGRIKVTVYGAKSMAQSDTELGEIVRQNTVQMVNVPTHTLSAMANIPEYKIFEFPYLFSSWEEIYKVLDSDMAKRWAQKLEKDAGVTVYHGLVKGWLSIGTKKGPINVPGDLKGLKIRTMSTDMQMGLISSFGASPTIIAYGELYTAVQQGTVDGMLTATSLYKTDKFCEVIKYLSIVRATAHFHMTTINKKWLDSLPADLRAIFDQSIKDFTMFARDGEKKLDGEAIIAMEKENGVKIRQYTEQELAPFKTATKAVWEKNYDLPGKGVLDDVLKFLGKDYKTLLQ